MLGRSGPQPVSGVQEAASGPLRVRRKQMATRSMPDRPTEWASGGDAAPPYIAGLSLGVFRLALSSGLIGRPRLTPLGGIGDMNHLS